MRTVGKYPFSTDDKIKIAAITLFFAFAAFFISAFFLILSLLSRPLHGSPPSRMVYVIPIIVAIIAGLVSAIGSYLFYLRKHRFSDESHET